MIYSERNNPSNEFNSSFSSTLIVAEFLHQLDQVFISRDNFVPLFSNSSNLSLPNGIPYYNNASRLLNDSRMSNSTAIAIAASHYWGKFFNVLKGALTFLGVVGNGLVIYTLIRKSYQSKFASSVFMHQTVMDLVVCFLSVIMFILDKPNADTGVTTIDAILCHAWTSQLIYWYFVFLSVQNLLLIALDRYWAVFRPMTYKNLMYKQAAFYIIIMHLYSLLINSADIFMVKYQNGSCTDEYLIPGNVSKSFFKAYGILWFFLVYLIPVAAVSALYTVIIIRLTRGCSGHTSQHRQRAATELTKSAVVITIIFIICFSYDSTYYLLGNVGIVHYEFNTAIQTFGVFLVALNSCANPLVYCIVMRSFRVRMVSAMCCCIHWRRANLTGGAAACVAVDNGTLNATNGVSQSTFRQRRSTQKLEQEFSALEDSESAARHEHTNCRRSFNKLAPNGRGVRSEAGGARGRLCRDEALIQLNAVNKDDDNCIEMQNLSSFER